MVTSAEMAINGSPPREKRLRVASAFCRIPSMVRGHPRTSRSAAGFQTSSGRSGSRSARASERSGEPGLFLRESQQWHGGEPNDDLDDLLVGPQVDREVALLCHICVTTAVSEAQESPNPLVRGGLEGASPSVSRILSRTAIHLGAPLLTRSCGLPGT